MEDMYIPFGLCDITFGQQQLKAIGSEGIFSSVSKFEELRGGQGNEIVNFIESNNEVKFTISLTDASKESLKLYMSNLTDYKGGLLDTGFNGLNSAPLIIHPRDAGESKEYDICIFNAYISPKTPFERIYDKSTVPFNIEFVARKTNIENFKSKFFIGDWSELGVMNFA
ncbi:hypothetical protein [Jeotgalibacillus malaysiensis]|uniref:hypothetical protein n=1 Tax=Jeotgalibacillus malaysiensis TaxID=1508404 RepID=UPI00384F069E